MKTVKEWVEAAREATLGEMDLERIKDSGILPGRGSKFFPVVGYPPLTMFTDMDETPLFEDLQSRPEYPLLSYLHMPFCPMQCTYCHWITQLNPKDDEVDTYIDYLIREMQLYMDKMGVESVPVRTILWGGGTPTYPKAHQLERLLKAYTKFFDISGVTQFSVEADPTTLLGDEGLDRLKVLRDYGVDRISLGVQAIDDKVLSGMGRNHTHAQTLKSIEQIRKAEIPIVYIDLIYGYPNLTVETWAQNMMDMVQMDIDGYQMYRLRIKQHGDKPGKIVQLGKKKPDRFPTANEVFQMKWLSIAVGEAASFNEYHTRLFAKKPEYISQYLVEWQNNLCDVIGVGVSAWTNLRGVFSFNVGDISLKEYYGLIDAGKIPIDRGKIRTLDDEARRSFVVPIKNNRVNKVRFAERTSITVHEYFGPQIERLKGLSLMEEDDTEIWLTKRGKFFVDEVCQQFFHPDYLPFPEVAGFQVGPSAGTISPC